MQKYILACQIFENHSFCNVYGCRWLLQGAKKTNFQVCPSTSLDFIFSSFPKTYLLQYFWNLNFFKRISLKLCIYWAEWTSLLARLSDMTLISLHVVVCGLVWSTSQNESFCFSLHNVLFILNSLVGWCQGKFWFETCEGFPHCREEKEENTSEKSGWCE